MRDDRVYLTYISESIDLIEEYLKGPAGTVSEQSFFNDLLRQDAVIRRLETLTDAASHLSNDLKHRNPQIPWRTISDFRNVMAHGYVDIRPEIVWKTIIEDLPEIRTLVEVELQRLNPDNPAPTSDS